MKFDSYNHEFISEPKLFFNNVYIRPCKSYIESRKDVSLEVEYDFSTSPNLEILFRILYSIVMNKKDNGIKAKLDDYGNQRTSKLRKRLGKISKKLGGQTTKKAEEYLNNNNLPMFCRLLLINYYDKLYQKAYDTRNTHKQIIKIKNEKNNEIINRILETDG